MTAAPQQSSGVVVGHWSDPDPAMIEDYAGRSRGDLMHGGMTDFALANRQFMAGRSDLDLVAWQAAAKERIRWLSVQLAQATSLTAHAKALHDAGPLILTAEEYNRICAKINARAKCREILG